MKKDTLFSIAILSLAISSNPTEQSKLFCQKRIRNEANISNIDVKDSPNNNDGYIALTGSNITINQHPSGGSSDRKVNASDLSKNKVENCDNYNGLTTGNFRSDTWRGSNMIGRYMDINVTSIKKVTGVYSHFGSYFDYNILKSGSVRSTIEKSNKYTDTKTESFSFSISIDDYVEAKLEAKADLEVISASVGVGTKIGATYTYGCTYTRSTTQAYQWTDTFTISSATAEYCPEGYSLSFGKQGTYYVIEGNYQETSIWWWGDNITTKFYLGNSKSI